MENTMEIVRRAPYGDTLEVELLDVSASDDLQGRGPVGVSSLITITRGPSTLPLTFKTADLVSLSFTRAGGAALTDHSNVGAVDLEIQPGRWRGINGATGDEMSHVVTAQSVLGVQHSPTDGTLAWRFGDIQTVSFTYAAEAVPPSIEERVASLEGTVADVQETVREVVSQQAAPVTTTNEGGTK